MALVLDRSRAGEGARQAEEGADPPGLTIELLGGFRVSIGARTIDESEWYLRKAKSLIKLLALAENHRLHRGQIMDLLWPELELSAATNNLHKALYVARRVLEPSLPAKASSQFLHLNGDLVTLNVANVWIDVEAFRAAVDRAQAAQDLSLYQKAVALYGGELLPEDRYEEWTVRPREDLCALYLALLLECAEFYAHRGESSEAIDVLRHVISIDHANEQAHISLIHLLASSGQRQAALRQYGLLRDALHDELGAEPDAAAQKLYSEILSGRYEPGLVATPEPVIAEEYAPSQGLVGRDNALRRVQARMDGLFDGQGSIVFLHGEAGMGKSSLAAVLQNEAVQRGAVALWGAAYKDDGPMPYSVLATALEGFALRVAPETLGRLAEEFAPELAHLAPAFARVLPRRGAARTAHVPDEDRTVAALVHFFTVLSDHVPVVITLEDLHLADPGTIGFLAHMMRLVSEMQVLFLCTFRSDEIVAQSDLSRLCSETDGEQIECVAVEPLSRTEIREAAGRLLGAPISDEVLSIISTISQGSPYYLEEAAWGLRGRRRIEQVKGVWQVRKGIRVTWNRDDVRKLVDAPGDFHLARKLRSI